MTKRLKLFLVILLGSIAIACCVAGCKIGKPTKDDLLADYNGGQVTYYANGGCFDDSSAIVIREMYFKDADVPFFEINEGTNGTKVNYLGYDFVGWYLAARYESGEHAGEIMYTYTYNNVTVPVYPKLKENGTPVTDSTGARPVFYYTDESGSVKDVLEKHVKVVPDLTQPVDSTRLIGADDKLIVCANWKPSLKFVYKLAVDEPFEYEGETYQHGTIIGEMAFGKVDTNSPGQSQKVAFAGMTFVSNYEDETCTTYASSSYNRADYDGQNEIVVWSKYIKGTWTVIKNSVDSIKTMFSNLGDSSKAYYLLEDVNCSTQTFPYIKGGMNATIEGNGHTLKNLKFEVINFTFSNGLEVAPVFGDIGATAQIKNLTLENVTVAVKCNGSMIFHAICNSVAEGARFENFTINGINATVTLHGTVSNAQDGDRSSWIFGGKGTDENFLNAYSGITLTGTTNLTIQK